MHHRRYQDIRGHQWTPVAINDPYVMVDLLYIVKRKPPCGSWTCAPPRCHRWRNLYRLSMSICPDWVHLPETISAAVPGPITGILAVPPSVGVDTSQEERLHKYRVCFKQLKSKLGLKGLNGSAFGGLLLRIASLD